MAVSGFGQGLVAAAATRPTAIIANFQKLVDISVYTDDASIVVDDDVDTFQVPPCSNDFALGSELATLDLSSGPPSKDAPAESH